MRHIQQLNMNIQNASKPLQTCVKQHALSNIAYNTPHAVSSIQPREISSIKVQTSDTDGRIKVDITDITTGFPAVEPPQMSGAGPRSPSNVQHTTPTPAFGGSHIPNTPTPNDATTSPSTTSPLPSGTLRGDEMLCQCTKQYPLNIPGQNSQMFVSKPMGPTRA